MIERLLAPLEVAGRRVVTRIPNLRGKVTTWVRRPPKTLRPVSLHELGTELRALGLGGGRDLLVHASWDGIPQLQAKPSELLALLKQLSEGATLLMPAHPPEKLEDGLPFYDAQRSFSRMGMLSESLRRTPGAKRSPVPIAPVCALGPSAERYTRDYRAESGGTPWGRGSPWWVLGEQRGQVLVIGIHFVRTLTLMHCAFDVLGDENPIRDYYEPITWLVQQGGAREQWPLRHQRRDLDQHLATSAFARMAVRSGTVVTKSVGGIAVAVVDAKAFLDWHLPIARRTGLPYWGFRRRS